MPGTALAIYRAWQLDKQRAMATGPASPNVCLGESDLGALHSALYPARKRYKSFALQIGVELGEIEDVEGMYSDHGERLLGILSVRIKKEEPLTWNDIDAALRLECVGEIKTANKIRKKYGHLFSPDRDTMHEQHEEQVHEKERKQHEERVREKERKQHEERVREKERKQHEERVREKERKQHEERVREKEHEERVHEKERKQHEERIREKERKQHEERVREKERKQHEERVHEKEHEERVRDKGRKQHEERVREKERKQHEKQIYEKERKQHEEQLQKKDKKKQSGKSTKSTKYDYHLQCEQQSSEQEEDLYKDVSKGTKQKQYWGKSEESFQSIKGKDSSPQIQTKRGKAQKHPEVRKGSEGEHKEEIKNEPNEQGLRKEGKTKQKKKAKKESVRDDVVVGEQESESDDDSIHKQKTPKQASDQESCAISSEEEMVSSPFQRKTRGKGDKSKQSAEYVRKKSEYQEMKGSKKEKGVKKQRESAVLISHKKGQYPGTEVSVKPTHKSMRSKDVQSESESKDDSSTSNSADESVDLECAIKAAQGGKPVKHSDQYQKQDPEQVEGIKLEKEKKSGKKTKSAGEESPPNLIERKEKKRRGQVSDTPKTLGRERYCDTQSKPGKERKRERQVSSKKPTSHVSDFASNSAQSVSEDEESDSGDSSEDEQHTDSEQESLNEESFSEEEEKAEPGEESSPTTGEEEVKEKSGKSKPAMKLVGAEEPDLPKDDEQSDASGRETHRKKKRRRRKPRESSFSPVVKGSSSPSTSQEENQKQPGPKEKKKKEKKKEKEAEKLPQSSVTDDSSPECDMTKNNQSQVETKELSNVFECFFGQLCCVIVNPVGLAAKLQKKGLISKSVMKDLMMSPESQQAKTINLVDKVDEKIKSQPDTLFEFIKVLLENEDLQESGRDMLREAGK